MYKRQSKYIEFVNRDESVDYDIRMKELQLELADILRQEAKSRESVHARNKKSKERGHMETVVKRAVRRAGVKKP